MSKSKEQKDGMTKDEKERVQSRRQEAHEQFKMRGWLKKGKLQAKGKDRHESSTLRHMVTSCFNDKGNLLR